MDGKVAVAYLKNAPDKVTCQMLDYIQRAVCAEDRGNLLYDNEGDKFTFILPINDADRAFYPQLQHVQEVTIVTVSGKEAAS